LRWYINNLRAQLPEAVREQLVLTPESVAFNGPTDVRIFEESAQRVLQRPDDPAADQVLALYRGDLLAGLTVSASPVFDTWLFVREEALRRVFRRATVAVAQLALASGNPDRVIEPLARLIAVDPYFEDGHRLYIEANEALGRRAAAKAAFDRYQRILRLELQVEPPRDLAERYEPIVTAERPPPRDMLVSLHELTRHVVDWPGGEPAILGIHGSTMSAYALTALAEQLAPDVRFVAADLRGHGFSDKPPIGYTLDQHVDDLRQLIAVLDLPRPVVLGFSLGGAIAALLSTRIDCAGLILLDGVVGDRAFTDNAAAVVMPRQREALEARVGGFD